MSYSPESLNAQIGLFAEKLLSPAFGPEENRELTVLKNEIYSGFKTIRFPTKEEKDAAWQIFQTHLEALRAKQDVLQEGYRQFAREANDRLDRLEKLLDGKPDSTEGFRAIREAFAETDAFFRQPLWPGKEDRETAWTEFRLLRDRLRADEDAFYAHQREHSHQQKQGEWRRKQLDFLRMLEEKLFGQKVFKEKVLLREPQHREYIGKLEMRINNQTDFLERISAQREELLQKMSTADSPIYRARLADWIREKESKIAEINREITQIREKIAAVEVDISLIPLKAEEVDQSINDLEAKIAEVKHQLEQDTSA
jgi:hypothetical protein